MSLANAFSINIWMCMHACIAEHPRGVSNITIVSLYQPCGYPGNASREMTHIRNVSRYLSESTLLVRSGSTTTLHVPVEQIRAILIIVERLMTPQKCYYIYNTVSISTR